jgi:poly(3-hydroxybutyrate) depolymerase
MFARIHRRYPKPSFGIDSIEVDGAHIPIHEEVVFHKPFCSLLRLTRKDVSTAPKLLVVAPLSGHFATLLRDTVRTALHDFDVYVTDWIDARLVPLSEGPFHLDDYIEYVMEFMIFLGSGAHTLAVCQPTVPVLAAVALLAERSDPCTPSTMTLMAGPIDTRLNPTEVNRFANSKTLGWFEKNVIHSVPVNQPGFRRKVYPGFLQHMGFVAMNPDRHMKAYRDFYLDVIRNKQKDAEAHRSFYDEYNAVLDMAAEYYLDTIRVVFQEQLMPRRMMTVRGHLVRPELIRKTALFTVEGAHDDIVGIGQTRAAQTLCRGIPESMRKHLLAEKVGHYGVFSGHRFREQIYPQIRDFIAQHAPSQSTVQTALPEPSDD